MRASGAPNHALSHWYCRASDVLSNTIAPRSASTPTRCRGGPGPRWQSEPSSVADARRPEKFALQKSRVTYTIDTVYSLSTDTPEQENPMNIGEAVTALKSDKWIRRVGWNGKGMHVYLEDELEAAIGSRSERVSRGRKVHPYLVLFTAAGTHQPGWNASTPDLLADDWEVVPEEEMR